MVGELRRGASFADVARTRSIIAATRESGGVMGSVGRGELEKRVEEVAFRWRVGEISDPIKTSHGWQIIRVSERTPAAEPSFLDVREDVKQILLESRRQKKYRRLLEGLLKKAKTSVYPERFR